MATSANASLPEGPTGIALVQQLFDLGSEANVDHKTAMPFPPGARERAKLAKHVGLPDSELGIGADSIVDPDGDGPRIWFRVEPDAKVVKNRLHLDIHVSGGRSVVERNAPLATRTQRVNAEASRLTALGAVFTGALSADGLDHYAAGMNDPEGNEFDIN